MLALDQDNGFAKVGAWRHEDGEYIEGYVQQKKLFNVIPNVHYGILIDKNTQQMTIYEDGVKIGQIAVSTGLMDQDKLFRETRAGAFLTTDRIINFKNEGYMYNYAIRIDGGNLLHTLGCKIRNNKWDYSDHLAVLGTKASHGCVRMDTRMNEQGLNAYWLWTHIPYYTKVLVIDDPEARHARLAEINAPEETAVPEDAQASPGRNHRRPLRRRLRKHLPRRRTLRRFRRQSLPLRPNRIIPRIWATGPKVYRCCRCRKDCRS